MGEIVNYPSKDPTSDTLKSGDDGGTYDGMNAIGREEHDAKIAALEGRIDGSLALINEKLGSLPTHWSMFTTMVGVTAAALGIGIAIMALAGDRFDGGFNIGVQSIDKKLGVDKIAAENNKQSDQIQTLTTKFDGLSRSVEGLSKNISTVLIELKAQSPEKTAPKN